MEQSMIVNVVGAKSDGNQTDHMSLVTTGRYYEKDGVRTLEYEESVPENDSMITTVLSVENDVVSLSREGGVMMHQVVFQLGKRCYNVYSTPFGSMEMSVFPLNVAIDLSEKGGSVELSYELAMNGRFVGTNELSMTFMPRLDYEHYSGNPS